MKIEVLGSGCPRCRNTEENVRKALAELSRAAEVQKVTDVKTIASRGGMATPALAIDGKLVLQGKVPTVQELKQLIAGA